MLSKIKINKLFVIQVNENRDVSNFARLAWYLIDDEPKGNFLLYHVLTEHTIDEDIFIVISKVIILFDLTVLDYVPRVPNLYTYQKEENFL